MATFSHIPAPFQSVVAVEPRNCDVTLPSTFQTGEIVGDSAAMKRLRLQVRRIGPHFRTVLIQGEYGTGKSTVARALHRASLRADGPFVTASPGNRIAYLMKIAQRGSLFFAGIDILPLDMQDELLEALRKHEWAQDGLAAPQKLATQIIASAKQDLRGLVAMERFRRELYQRVAMVQVPLVPLRQRMEDVPLLTKHFLDRYAKQYHKKSAITKEAIERLTSHNWPGNVAELAAVLEDAVLRSEREVIQATELVISSSASEIAGEAASPNGAPETIRLQTVMNQHVLRVLKDCGGNKLRAAELLGISRSTLYRMLDASASDTCQSS